MEWIGIKDRLPKDNEIVIGYGHWKDEQDIVIYPVTYIKPKKSP